MRCHGVRCGSRDLHAWHRWSNTQPSQTLDNEPCGGGR